MQAIKPDHISTDPLLLPAWTEKNIRADVLRLDKIHPLVSGNKWFKLRFYLADAIASGKKTIVTFGGAWSNHILATAAACRLNGLDAIGLIRGERAEVLSATLIQAMELGMQLHFYSRKDYAQQKIPEELNNPGYYFIREGGYGLKGAEGAGTILNHCRQENYTHICCAAGTGTMAAGLIHAADPACRVVAVSVLKNNKALDAAIRELMPDREQDFHLLHDYHFGGYAKHQPELIRFMNEWYQQSGIPSDFVYTGKLFFAIHDLVQRDFFAPGSRLLIVHSGGLQGNASLSKGMLIF